MIVVAAFAVLSLVGCVGFLLWDNVRLRSSLVTALTTPAPVAGAIITSKKEKARTEPEPLPLGV